MWRLLSLLLQAFLLHLSTQSDLENAIVGLPVIFCERDRIRFEVETIKPFKGKVFVKGEYANGQCIKTYADGKPLAAGKIVGVDQTSNGQWSKNLNGGGSSGSSGGDSFSQTGSGSWTVPGGGQGGSTGQGSGQNGHGGQSGTTGQLGQTGQGGPSGQSGQAGGSAGSGRSGSGSASGSSGSGNGSGGSSGSSGSGNGSGGSSGNSGSGNGSGGSSGNSGSGNGSGGSSGNSGSGNGSGGSSGNSGSGNGSGSSSGNSGSTGNGAGSSWNGANGGKTGGNGNGESHATFENDFTTGFENGNGRVSGKQGSGSGSGNLNRGGGSEGESGGKITVFGGKNRSGQQEGKEGGGQGLSGTFQDTKGAGQGKEGGHGGSPIHGFPSPDNLLSTGTPNGRGPSTDTYGYVGNGREESGSLLSEQLLNGQIKIFPSQCPSTCAPCACEREGQESIHRERRQTNKVQLEVMLGTCHAKRDRVVSPPGVHISFVAVVSFHDSFITKLDKAYHIRCAYTEANKTVDTQIDVSAPTPDDLSNTVPPPRCEYKLQSKDGRDVRNVQVGDTVKHEWICQTEIPEMYGMLVHSCFVEDGAGQRQQIVDENGCSLDPSIIPSPSYSSGSLSASVDAYAFRFPDQETLDFQCSIKVCTKEGGDCEGITPPICSSARSAVSRRRRSTPSDNDWTLHAPTLTVVDLDGSSDRPEALSLFSDPPSSSVSSSEMCLSVAGFGVLVASCTFLGTVAMGILLAYFFIREKM